MTPNRWCSHCRSDQPIEWREDPRYGPTRETASCPHCGAPWGTRARRPLAAAIAAKNERGGAPLGNPTPV